jgi:predicted Na+-dependent transporter
MLIELLSKTASVAILCFVVSSMLGVGASLTVSAIVEPLRNVRLVVLSLLANFILMPLVAIGLEKDSGLTDRLVLDFWYSDAPPARHSFPGWFEMPGVTSLAPSA